jgi:hypothetical protein
MINNFEDIQAATLKFLLKHSGQVSELDRLALSRMSERWKACSEEDRQKWLEWTRKTVAELEDCPELDTNSANRALMQLLTFPLAGKGWDMDSLMSIGDQIWKSMEFSVDDSTVAERVGELVGIRDDDVASSLRYTWLYRWTDVGFPTVKISAPFAAAAMTTLSPDDVLDDLKSPWRSFLIDMPTQPVLYLFDKRNPTLPFPVTHVGVLVDDTTQPSSWSMIINVGDYSLMTIRRHPRTMGRSGHQCAECGEAHSVHSNDLIDHPWDELTDQYARVMMLAGRLVVGVVSAMTDYKNVRKVDQQTHNQWGSKVRRVHQKPEQRIYQITTPVTVNLVDHVTEYQLHKKGKWSMALRYTVAGHRKLQPCGPKLSERKLVWIQPYWRGPTDAPVAVRPHVIKP